MSFSKSNSVPTDMLAASSGSTGGKGQEIVMQARTSTVALAAAALLLMAGCGSSPTSQGADSTAKAGGKASATGSGIYAPFAGFTGADREQKLLDGAVSEGAVLDIYTSNTDEDDLIKAFTAKYPKIKVNNFRANSETVLQRALLEHQARQADEKNGD